MTYSYKVSYIVNSVLLGSFFYIWNGANNSYDCEEDLLQKNILVVIELHAFRMIMHWNPIYYYCYWIKWQADQAWKAVLGFCSQIVYVCVARHMSICICNS